LQEVNLIFAEQLTKVFDEFTAVNSINLDVPEGNVLVLLGPNGAGKTTTVRMLTSVLRPTRGRALVAGYDVVQQADQVRASVGVLTESHGLYGRSNAEEYLQFFGRLYGLNAARRRQQIDRLLEMFGLAEARNKRLGEYSKGMRQKLALVRALLHEPPVLLLDEPTSAMDPESAHMVRQTIRGLRSSDRTIILCTHNLLEAELLADQIAIIRRGRIIYDGVPAMLKRALLGPEEYEVRLSQPLNGWEGQLPNGVELTERGQDWLRFQIEDPQHTNPLLLQHLLSEHLPVIAFQEVPHSLEDAYLEAVSRAVQEEEHVA
jgi:ABC-2 type transport system ATP-binding protein